MRQSLFSICLQAIYEFALHLCTVTQIKCSRGKVPRLVLEASLHVVTHFVDFLLHLASVCHKNGSCTMTATSSSTRPPPQLPCRGLFTSLLLLLPLSVTYLNLISESFHLISLVMPWPPFENEPGSQRRPSSSSPISFSSSCSS